MRKHTLEAIQTLIREGQLFDEDAAVILGAMAAQPLLSQAVKGALIECFSDVEDTISADDLEVDDTWMGRQDEAMRRAA